MESGGEGRREMKAVVEFDEGTEKGNVKWSNMEQREITERGIERKNLSFLIR